jgi:hypothetical protein
MFAPASSRNWDASRCAGGLGTSAFHNATNPEGFWPAVEAIDVLRALPGTRVEAAAALGLLGETEGRPVAKVSSSTVGGGAIAREVPIAEASVITCE